jgi:hypothetical protein
MPLTSRDLRPADIIVSTTNAGVSAVIRNAIGSSVSHCILYVGGSNVVEAIDRGVVNNPLEEALSHATLAIVLRRRNLTVKQRNDVVAAANGFVWKNLPYDALGAAAAGVYTRRGLALGISDTRVFAHAWSATPPQLRSAPLPSGGRAGPCSGLPARPPQPQNLSCLVHGQSPCRHPSSLPGYPSNS